MDLERMSAPPVYAADVEGRRVEGDARCEHLMDLYWSEMITHARSVVALAEYHPELAVNADGSHALLLEYHTNLEIECEEHAKVTGHRLPVTAPALQQAASHETAGALKAYLLQLLASWLTLGHLPRRDECRR